MKLRWKLDEMKVKLDEIKVKLDEIRWNWMKLGGN